MLDMVKYSKGGPTNFEDLLAPLPQDIREVATQLRAIIQEAAPNADEAVSGGEKIGMALYSVNGPNNVFCGMQPTEDMCRLFFHSWQQLKNAGYRLDGSGKHARHIKIRSSQNLEPEVYAGMLNTVLQQFGEC